MKLWKRENVKMRKYPISKSNIQLIVGCWILGVCTFAYSGEAAAPVADAVPFRGVVEGYYGRPWGTEGRLSLLKFMGENDLNVFIYGPKDDPYHHSKWREPYPEAEMRDFAKLLEVAKANKIAFYWAIHLGGAFKNDREADYAALFRKLGLMYDAGFRAFAVFFDDFGEPDAKLHSEICKRIVTGFLQQRGDCAPLIMCPRIYWGWWNAYLKDLGKLLDERVNVLWTGSWIMSDIRAEDVAKATECLERPPFVWWNWPVNDYCRSSLLLGRTYGLEKCKLAGIVSNPMENCEANKIALYSFAKWCANPDGFDSRKCWEESFAKLYDDPGVAHAMRVLAEHNSNPGPGVRFVREESVACAELCDKASKELEKDGKFSKETADALFELFWEIRRSMKQLKIKLPKGRYDLGWEIEGWLDDEMHLMEQAAYALVLLNPSVSPNHNRNLEADLEQLRSIRAKAVEDAAAHREKFAAATFKDDRRNVRSPKASPTVLRPLVEKMLTRALSVCYQKKFGKEFNATDGFAAFSTAKALDGLRVSREGNVAGIVRVMEPHEVAPGETFGLSIPSYWKSNYFHAELATPEAVSAGVIELSKDGSSWQKLGTRTKAGTGQMHTRLNPADSWRFARYRNASDKTVSLKIDLFKFDVQGADSPADFLLDEVLK
jgi:hyaluronoglucosaminidase